MKKEKKRRRYLLWLLPVIGISFIAWTIWSNTALEVNEISITSRRIPPAFSGFRIAQVSDLHNTEFGKNHAELLKRLSACNPDIIAVTGDLVDAGHTDIEVAFAFAGEAVGIAPTYYVTGNHEAAISQYDILKSGLEAAGIVVLEDEAVRLDRGGESMTLIGLSDPDAAVKEGSPGDVPAMTDVRLQKLMDEETGYTVLLSHRPELFETYVSGEVDLVLSGHAHGGQFRLPFIGGLIAPNQGWFPKYDAGLYTDGHTNMVVSRGIGNSIIPFRFNNRPEIVLIELLSE